MNEMPLLGFVLGPNHERVRFGFRITLLQQKIRGFRKVRTF